MPITRSQLRASWIALAAFVGTLLASGDASASCKTMPDPGACPPVCGCCKAPEAATPIRDAGAPATARLPSPSRSGDVCPDALGCACRSQAPAAPEPKGQRAGENRPEPGRDVAVGWLNLVSVFRPFIGPMPPTICPPQKSPLYLRNSRLLI